MMEKLRLFALSACVLVGDVMKKTNMSAEDKKVNFKAADAIRQAGKC